jgi:CHAT domain-containing protein
MGQAGHNRSGGASSVAAALTEAMRDVLRQTPSLDPAFWAPFTVYVAGD